MTAPTIYWGGGEDSDMAAFGINTSVNTTVGSFRSAYARCSLNVGSQGQYWTNRLPYPASTTQFWFSARVNTPNASGAGSVLFITFVDASLFTRLQVVWTGSFIVQKVNTAGTATTLSNTLSAWQGLFSNNTDKIDIFWNNAVSGTINIYQNGILVYSYTGDTTTETTAISYHRLYCTSACNWSEVIVADTDTRSWNLQTLAPVANGNTHNFDIGSPAAGNVNETTLNDSTLDGSSSAGQIDQYTIPSIASGTYTIVALGVSARMQKGSSGPTKADLGVRSGGSDYWSSDKSLTTSWDSYQNWWNTDPNTSATWAALPSNIGLKSVA